MIGTILVLALSAATTVGGYFVTTAVLSNRVNTIEKTHVEMKNWQKDHHDKIEAANTTSDRNVDELFELREDFRIYIEESNEDEGNKK